MPEPSNTAAERIEELILQTTEVKDKALLLVMLEMSKSLNENTKLTQELHSEFKVHAKEEMTMIIKGRFLWRVLLSFALILQVILGYGFNEHVKSHKALIEEVKVLKIFKEKHEEHHRLEEVYHAKGTSPKN